MSIFDVMGGIVNDFFENLLGAPKHVNCRSVIVHPIFKQGKKYMDIIPPESYDRYQMRKWLSQIPHAAIVDNVAYVIVYNSEAPERSYVVREGL